MTEIFSLLSFLEGSHGAQNVTHPFANRNGDSITANSKSSKVHDLSFEARTYMNGKCISNFIYPTEEVFFCLVIAKFVSAQLLNFAKKDKDLDLSDIGCVKDEYGNILFPITPFKKSQNACYGKNDLDFFFASATHVKHVWLKDLDRNTDKSDRWMVLNFQAAAEAKKQQRAALLAGRGSTQTPKKDGKDNNSSVHQAPDFGFF